MTNADGIRTMSDAELATFIRKVYLSYDFSMFDFNLERWLGKPLDKEEKVMKLSDTIELMTSENWQDRFKAEYLQTKIRYEKLHEMIIRREAGKLDFETPIPFESWVAQERHMGLYLHELELQAAIHGIALPKITV